MARKRWTEPADRVRPMLARLADPPLVDERLVYEPKYDGIRALVEVAPPHAPGVRAAGRRPVRIWSRLGNEKTAQFPDVAAAFAALVPGLKGPLLIDGEIVALDGNGEAAGFQRLQGRLHLTADRDIERALASQPSAFIAFDLLRDDDEDLRPLPLATRRVRLEQRLGGRAGRVRARGRGVIRLSPLALGDGRPLYEDAERRGLEGLIAKDVGSPYLSGQRPPFWRKLKVTRRQEFVVGGWTDPRGTRPHFGALLLGVYPQRPAPSPQRLIYVGSVGSGFDQRELERLAALLDERRTGTCPFASVPRGVGRAHWVRPELVVEVRYTEWTDEGYLRHPVYLGQRADKRAEEVIREPDGPATPSAPSRSQGTGAARRRASAASQQPGSRAAPGGGANPAATLTASSSSLLPRLQDLEARGRDGVIELPDGHGLKVTNLRKVFWPGLNITKGELLRYYVEVAPGLLPALDDRPLVMKRFPNGVGKPAFYQQRAPDRVPAGVRAAVVPTGEDEERMTRLIGGGWTTLLYTVQLAAISQDPWFSRASSPLEADYAAFDLDPMEGVPFARVLDVARWIHDELRTLKVSAVPKTSGSRGLHIYVPLAPGTPYEAGLLFCQIVATIVAERHPSIATLERLVARRGRKVYIDCLQNIAGKTLATAYSARASDYAGVSAPLDWKEVHDGVDPRDFTIRTVPARLREAGDLWAPLHTLPSVDLQEVLRRHGRRRQK